MAKYGAFGTTLKRGGVGGVAVAQIMSINGLSLALDTEDVTSHDSTGGWEEVVGTILRTGEVTLDLIYDPNHATHKNASGGLIYDLAQRSLQTWAITFPSNPVVSWTFSALVTAFEPSMPVDGALTASVTLKPSGQPTLA